MGVGDAVFVGVAAGDAVFVFVVTRKLMRTQPFEDAFLAGEVEAVIELGAVGIPLRRLPPRERLVHAHVGAEEKRIGGAIDEALVHIDEQLAGLAVGIEFAHDVALVAL